jgi:hypothetical protein
MLVKSISIIIDSIAIGMYFQIGKHCMLILSFCLLYYIHFLAYATRYDSGYFMISAL